MCTTNARITPFSVVVFYRFVSVCVLPNVFSLSFSCVPFASKVGLFSDDATTMSENRDGAHDDGKSKKRRIVRNNQKRDEKTHRHHPHRQQQQSMNPTTTATNIDFIEQSFLTIEDPLMMKFKPNREEIERALKRTTSSFVVNSFVHRYRKNTVPLFFLSLSNV